MAKDEIEIYVRALERERKARKLAEEILEQKSSELYNTTSELKSTNKKLERLLQDRENQLQGVFENIIDAYIVMDLWGNVLNMNAAAVEMLGYNIEDDDFNLFSVTDKSEIDNVMSTFETLISEGTVTDFRVKLNPKNGSQITAQVNASVIFDDENRPVAAQGIVRDITVKAKAEEELKNSEERLSLLIKNLDSGVLLENENREIVLVNKMFCDFFNIFLPPNQLVGQDCKKSSQQSKELFEDPEGFVSRIDEILERKQPVLGDELRMVSGAVLERDYIPIYRKNEYTGHLWSYRDITLKSKYRESLELEREKYRRIIANMQLGLVELDREGQMVMVNQSLVNMTGFSKQELVGQVAKDFLPALQDKELVAQKMQEKNQENHHGFELKIKNKQGDIRHWLTSGSPNYDFNGKVVGAIAVCLDITELKELQGQKEKLLEKLEKSNNELYEYAHIVSHDLKSPLRSINALVSWLKEDNADKLDEMSLQNIEHIETTLVKMEQLITDILEYSSAGSEDEIKEDVDLQTLISELISILYVPDHIDVRILNTLPTIKGDKTKLQQMFQNLISNAVKFMDKPEGKIHIDVENEGDYYKFSVKDNGIGIEKQYFDKIFKVFHSINKRKDSSGIGLSIVKKIVDLHDGKVWLESEVGTGTTFYFTLKK